jgi:hypothetical protein
MFTRTDIFLCFERKISNVSDQFLPMFGPNSTFFLHAERNPDGYFHQHGFPPFTDSFSSLVKFEKPDDDLSLDCLAGVNFSNIWVRLFGTKVLHEAIFALKF